MNRRMKTMSSAVTALPRYRHPTGICRQCARTKTGTQAPGPIISGAHAPPHGSCFGFRITCSEQQLRLMRTQSLCRFVSCRPPLETAFRQTLCGDPKPLPVIREDPDRLATPVAKDKQAARKRIGNEFLPAELRQRIYTLPSVDGFNRNQDAQLRRDLNQDAASNKARLSIARSETEAPFNWIRSLPWRPSTSRVHSGTCCV